ncbi:MAG TPA: lytic transglycosylase domain-containing protein [Candidatus Cybelea sp.]|nr:lytic transglycosylase domain-containing protein [Candidatus Cybelea sp.]
MKNMRFVPLCGAIVLSGCTVSTIYHTNARTIAPPQLQRALNIALSWPSPAGVDALQGAFLIRDGPAVGAAELAIARAILRTNPRLQPAYALLFAGATARAALSHRLPAEFLGATLLQESAYDPEALSSAGAIGIAQFMPETAADVGVDPYDPFESIEAAAALIGGYADAYQGRYADPYSAALAAYNAGPFAVARYRGVPPYAETREYIALIYDRWARIVSYERPGGN